MLPLFSKASDGNICLKPTLQLIFEQLTKAGFLEFCIVIGRGKRAVEDHFTPDRDYVEMLRRLGKIRESASLSEFYDLIEKVRLQWVFQDTPLGFGDAVRRAGSFVGDSEFLVHAGDTYIDSRGTDHLKRLTRLFYEHSADAAFIIQRIANPRQHGIIAGKEIEPGVFEVHHVVEKPEQPETDLAVLPIYIFKPTIIGILEATPPGVGGEVQLTDGIKELLDRGGRVYALKLGLGDTRLDVGSPENYRDALQHICDSTE
jgi:UTP--glucose-1-phosphate uridylyltransferase